MFKRQTLYKYIFNFFAGSITTICGVLAFGKTFFDLPIRKSVGLGILIYAGIFAICMLVWLFKNLYNSIKINFVNSVWGEGVIIRDLIFAEINSIRRKRFNEGSSIKALVFACNKIKEFFDSRTGSDTSVSIKIPVLCDFEYESMEMRNLCRDSQHFSRDNDKYKSIKHTVIGNTAYNSIVADLREQKSQIYYINNDIEHTKGYRNTSLVCYEDGLPYKSEIVVPIIPLNKDGLDYQMVGFLCLDSNNRKAFNDPRYDIQYLRGIADGLYDVVKRIVESN